MRANGIYTHQRPYIDQLKELDRRAWAGNENDDDAPEASKGPYSSLLGGVAWLTLTIASISVFVQALQRRNHNPRVVDCKRLNLVLRWARRHPIGIWFPRLCKPLRIVGVSDSAFRAQPEDSSGLALRGAAIVLNTKNDRSPTSPDGKCNVLEFVCKKHKRVIRSTYAG